jgi:cytochrome b involved in lipid metabolism
VTKFIPDHPGGDAILRNTGKDGTTGFSKIGMNEESAWNDANS